MKYSEIISVNNDVSSSINISFDLHNLAIVNQFIPTYDSCQILKKYISSILQGGTDQSTLLMGPYGKGKSFLILVLLEILSNANRQTELKPLLDRIDDIDSELFQMIQDLDLKGIRMLPVIVDSGYEDAYQALMIALNTSLRQNHLEHKINLDTTYYAAQKILNEWIKNQNNSSSALQLCLRKYEISGDQLMSLLKRFSTEGMEIFKRIYQCMSFGLDFNPLIADDITKLYADSVSQIESSGYSGIFVIYDEFGKALEGKTSKAAGNLKIIQDLAELANRSKGNRLIYFTCITHKSLSLYADAKNQNSLDSFKTVEGRFKEYRMVGSIQDSYNLLALKLEKKAEYSSIRDLFWSNHQNLLDLIGDTQILTPVQQEYLQENVFPMNPLAAPLLVRVSELVAQNERTLFTAISDRDEFSFIDFLIKNESGLYSTPDIYNYFQNQIKEAGEFSKKIWYQVETACAGLKNETEINLLKTLGLILLINDTSWLKPDETVLSAAANVSLETARNAISSLLSRKIITRSLVENRLDFSKQTSEELDYLVNKLSLKATKKDLIQTLNAVNQNSFVFPNRYNLKAKMRRYFCNAFLFSSELADERDFSKFFYSGSDGAVINVFLEETSIEELNAKLKTVFKKEQVLIRYIPDPGKEYWNLVTQHYAVMKIAQDTSIDSIVRNEALFFVNEEERELNLYWDEIFSHSRIFYWDAQADSFSESSNTLEQAASQLLTDLFSSTPVINNEMINKHVISPGYKKPMAFFIDGILRRSLREDLNGKSVTSPEANVYYSFFKHDELSPELRSSLNEIKSAILENLSKNESVSLSKLILKLKQPPFGIREGVLPALVSISVSEMQCNPILYFKTRQIKLNSENITKSVYNADSYFLRFPRDILQKENSLKQMISVLQLKDCGNFEDNLNSVTNELKKRISSFPLVIRETTLSNNFLKLPDNFVLLKKSLKGFDINSYDVVFDNLFSLFNNDLEQVIDFLKSFDEIHFFLDQYKNDLIVKILTKLGAPENSSIRTAFDLWLIQNSIDDSKIVLEGRKQKLKNSMKDLSYDNYSALAQITSIIAGYAIEDWAVDQSSTVLSELDDFLLSLKAKSGKETRQTTENEEMELSLHGTLLRNTLLASLEDFNESITNEEKIYILNELINEILR